MRFNSVTIAAALALAIGASPAPAREAQPSAAPLSIAGSVQRSAPAAQADGNQLAGRYGFLLPAALVLAFVAGIVIFSINGDPSSP
jgi:hypothetical protein